MNKQIIEAGRELAKLDPNNKTLQWAREWWKSGRPIKYSNQDFDVLNAITCELTRIKRGWK